MTELHDAIENMPEGYELQVRVGSGFSGPVYILTLLNAANIVMGKGTGEDLELAATHLKENTFL